MNKTFDKMLILYFLFIISMNITLWQGSRMIIKQRAEIASEQKILDISINEQKILVTSIKEQKMILKNLNEQKNLMIVAESQKPLAPIIKKEPYFIKVINGQITNDSLLSVCDFVGPKYNISPELLYAMCETESTRFVNARNGSCKGLMQINETYHRGRMIDLNITDIYDPYGNILLAADYINELGKEKNNIYYNLMRYNMETKTANKLFAKGIISNYALSIVSRSKELEQLNRK